MPVTNKRFYRKPSSNATTKPSTSKNLKNAKWLVIVESPSKCSKIEEYLSSLEFDPIYGGKYACIASKGHIRAIDGLKSINTKTNFEPTFTIMEGKERHINEMQEHIKAFPKENILIATDDDREGEAIGWHICELFGLPTESTKRILFHEITKTAICEAVKNPTIINMSLVYAQHSRQVLDIVVGYTISPILWKHIYNDKLSGLSAGRCQTPALRLIYDHSQEYATQPVVCHSIIHGEPTLGGSKRNCSIHGETTLGVSNVNYKTTGVFFDRNIRFELSHHHNTETELLQFMELSKTHKYTLEMMPTKETYKSPPKPFTTSRLLQTASSILKCSPKKTMELCQQLYQGGHITYMRTDSSKYSPVFLKQIETYIQHEWGNPKYMGDLTHLVNNDGANPHEAIRVTDIRVRNITDEDKSVVSMYKFIWKNTIESCMSTARYNSRLVKISAPSIDRNAIESCASPSSKQSHNPYYGYTLEIPIFLGWKIVSNGNDDGETQTTTCVDIATQQTGLQFYLESFLSNNNLRNSFVVSPVIPRTPTQVVPPCSGVLHNIRVNYIESKVVAEHRNPHYTEASLIQRLEELGIGRPSTYATIVETIQERGYVKKMDIKGQTVKCNEYKLRFDMSTTSTLEKTEIEKAFGNEKGKLSITPTGIIVLEFLVRYFESLFSYDYTKNMEMALDAVSLSVPTEASIKWSVICSECYNLIKQLKKPLSKIKRETYTLDKNAELVFHSNGASIKLTGEDGTTEYRTVKKTIEIDLGKLKNGEYSVEDLLEIPNEHLGTYEGNNITLKSGRYGLYFECGETKMTLKQLNKPADEITMSDILPILLEKQRDKTAIEHRNELYSGDVPQDLSAIANNYREISAPKSSSNDTNTKTNTTRPLNEHMSVRMGKYGAYVYYKNAKMKTPSFFNIKKFKENCWDCKPETLIEWVKNEYRVV
jgi:DNA topoisomerase-1